MVTLVAYWLHEPPAEDLGVFGAQVARALWMERRVMQTVADIMSKVMGGK